MRKISPIHVMNAINKGIKTYKPELKQCALMQDSVISELIPGDKHISELVEEAEIKAEHREEVRYENDEIMFKRDLDEWDPDEVL